MNADQSTPDSGAEEGVTTLAPGVTGFGIDDEATDTAAGGSDEGARGRAAIMRFAKLAPPSPGVYRMVDARGDVLYVGKAKNIRKRILAYARPTGHDTRIARMIAATATIEFVSTATETEALLLEANLIKRLRPRFNVLLRDDKSFPYILISADHPSPQILKHRGARGRPGDYFGPFASAWAVNRTITALQRAFLLRSCADGVFETRTRPCLLHQIKRCSGPCTGEVSPDDYAGLTRDAKAFLSGRSRAVCDQLAAEMDHAAEALDFERAAVYRDRLAALSTIQAHQGINPRNLEEADVFAIHQEGGLTCVEVFFFRTGQNWGNRAYFPRADQALEPGEVLGAFLAQFYEDKPCPRLVLISHPLSEQALLQEALSIKSGHKVEILAPQRGEKRDVVEHARANAREALLRKLAETSSQQAMLAALAERFGLPRPPQRIEVYDNSHIQGSNAVGAMVVAGPEGFRKSQYRKFNIRAEDLTPGDDFGMMREMLRRRFKRLLAEARKGDGVAPAELDPATAVDQGLGEEPRADSGPEPGPDSLADLAEEDEPASASDQDIVWPQLLLIDGGAGQLKATADILAELGVDNVPIIAIAKGPDREAGRETFFMVGREPFRLPPRDPLLHFVERLRDEAHRFAIGSHRQRRSRSIREGGLQEIEGIGPQRKRALLRHFGTLKAVERASVADLSKVPGVNADTARRVYDFFHGPRT